MAENKEWVVVTARRLSDGSPIYLTANGTWTGALQEASPRSPEEGQAEATQRGQSEQSTVVDPYTFKVEVRDGFIDALSTRERIRSAGPTVRLRRPD